MRAKEAVAATDGTESEFAAGAVVGSSIGDPSYG